MIKQTTDNLKGKTCAKFVQWMFRGEQVAARGYHLGGRKQKLNNSAHF